MVLPLHASDLHLGPYIWIGSPFPNSFTKGTKKVSASGILWRKRGRERGKERKEEKRNQRKGKRKRRKRYKRRMKGKKGRRKEKRKPSSCLERIFVSLLQNSQHMVNNLKTNRLPWSMTSSQKREVSKGSLDVRIVHLYSCLVFYRAAMW